MLKNKKVMLAIAIPILALAGYTMTKPKPVVKTKIKGTLYNMPQSFLLNLTDGRYAKLTISLQLAPGQSDGATAGTAASSEGPGTLPEEAIVREIVTNTVTNQSGETLVSSAGRKGIRQKILLSIRRDTDLKVESVLIPDLTVQ